MRMSKSTRLQIVLLSKTRPAQIVTHSASPTWWRGSWQRSRQTLRRSVSTTIGRSGTQWSRIASNSEALSDVLSASLSSSPLTSNGSPPGFSVAGCLRDDFQTKFVPDVMSTIRRFTVWCFALSPRRRILSSIAKQALTIKSEIFSSDA